MIDEAKRRKEKQMTEEKQWPAEIKITRIRSRMAELRDALQWIAGTEAKGHEYRRVAKYALIRHDQSCLKVGNDQVLAYEGLSATACSACGKPHRLCDEDAGLDQEIVRLCHKCFEHNTQDSGHGPANPIVETEKEPDQ